MEECEIAVARLRVGRCPHNPSVVLIGHDLMCIDSVFVHLMILFVCEQRECERIVLRHLASEEERRMADAPQGHHGQLFVLCEVGPVSCIAVGISRVGYCRSNLSERQHVAVSIVARTTDAAPEVGFGEDGIDGTPVVPQVVHHAPHVGILKTSVGILELGLARAERENDGPSCLVDSTANHAYLVGIERTREVVDLQEIDTPLGIEVHDAVVVELSELVVAHPQVIAQPSARRCGAIIYRCPWCAFAAFQLIVAAYHHFRYTTHEVYAKLQAHAVQLVGQGLETAVHTIDHTRWESCWRREVATVLIEHIVLCAVLVIPSATQRRVVAIPAYVDYNILPSMAHEVVVNKILCILHHFLLCHR